MRAVDFPTRISCFTDGDGMVEYLGDHGMGGERAGDDARSRNRVVRTGLSRAFEVLAVLVCGDEGNRQVGLFKGDDAVLGVRDAPSPDTVKT